MRGLTAIEREYLYLPENVELTHEQWFRYEQAAESLRDAGRLRVFMDQSDGCEAWRKNDIGRLALRVCPVDE